MLRGTIVLCLGLILMFCCSKQPADIVTWQPKQPKAGQTVKITFSPERLTAADQKDSQVYMICQCVSAHHVKTSRIPMSPRGKNWQADIGCEPRTLLLRIKFEDALDRLEDHDGYGWNIILLDSTNHIPKNSYHRLGIILSQKRPLSLTSKEDEAYQAFQAELSLYTDNYQCWLDLWNLRQKKSFSPQSENAVIRAQLDSLLQHSTPSPDLLALAFECNWKLLNDPKAAIAYGQKLLAMGDTIPHKDAIDYGMILIDSEQSPQQFIERLMRFVQQAKDPNYLKAAYYQLGLFFQNIQMDDHAIYYFSKYTELVPEEIPIWLNLANLHIRKQNLDRARDCIQQAQLLNTSENYFQSHPWEPPEERANQLIMNQCQILSTQANLESMQRNFQAAIRYRQQALGLGTPFPAFEWTKIGELFLQLGRIDSAQQAYIKAVSFDPNQDEAIQQLKQIYRATHGNISGFEEFLTVAINQEQRSSAKVAPDFIAKDMSGRQHRLFDQLGKIIVLTFWDSWSIACQQEIPQLNHLVEMHRNNDQIVFWALSVEPPAAIDRFIVEQPFQFTLFPNAISIKRLYQVIGVPTHIVIDPAGKIRYTHIGFSDSIGKELDSQIRALLSEAKPIS